jgi:hypothetical protein
MQRGTEVEITINGTRIEDAQELFFHTPGFETVKIENENDRKVKAVIRIAPDAKLGEHALRLRTKSGVTNLRTFFVGPFPTVEEKEPNNDFDEPQVISSGVTVEGVVDNEDVDYYAIEAKKGERISVEIEGLRLAQDQNSYFDPYIAILDAKRFEMAAEDDTTLLFQDAAASVLAPEDGRYVVMVREASYGGGGNSRYRLHVGHYPRPTSVYPAGGKAGEPTDVTFLGDPSGDIKANITPEGDAGDTVAIFAEHNGESSPSGNPFRLSAEGNVLEAEPNNTREQATVGEVPMAFNGILAEAGDEDWWKFTAKKGQEWYIVCHARSIRSPLDPVMSVHRADGGQMAANDDEGNQLDSRLKWKADNDGEYLIRVRDHLGRGGPGFVYRIEFGSQDPSVSATIPEYRRYSQDRNTIDIPKGNRYATLMTVNRQNYAGTVKFIADKLPPGVSMTVPECPRTVNQWPVMFEAAADAEPSGVLTAFRVEDTEGKLSGRYFQDALMVRGENNREFWTYRAPQMAIAVTQEAPFSVELVQPKVPLIRDGQMKLKVVAKRKEGFDQPIRVEFPFRPPGISAASNVTIEKGKNEVEYPINANATAPLETWPVLCFAQSDANGPLWVSTQYVNLTIGEPLVRVALERAAIEQGQTARIVAKLTVDTPFEGEAELTLIGLPEDLRPEPLKFKADTAELVFEIPTTESTLATKHRNLYSHVKIVREGEEMLAKQGSSELQIDKPLPKPVPKPEPPKEEPKAEKPKEEPKPEPPKQPEEKPLSRLERLRQAAEAAAAGG